MKPCGIINELADTEHNIEAWLSLVERCVRDAEVASSNLVASIPACWSSGQDDALSRRKPGFDSRTGHDLNRLSEIQIAGFLFPVSCGAGPPPKSLASPPRSCSLKILDTKWDAAGAGKRPAPRCIPFYMSRLPDGKYRQADPFLVLPAAPIPPRPR